MNNRNMKTKLPWWRPTRSAIFGGIFIALALGFVAQMVVHIKAERVACEAKGGVLQQRTYTCLRKDAVIKP